MASSSPSPGFGIIAACMVLAAMQAADPGLPASALFAAARPCV
ncbi:hypothetical protein [Slackia faecicanis]|nr:hypothetical protein [Slackia faecicanis]